MYIQLARFGFTMSANIIGKLLPTHSQAYTFENVQPEMATNCYGAI